MAKPKRRKECVEEHYEHPSKDRSDRFALDALIRDSGYVIFRRTKGKPVLWIRKGRVFSQYQILQRLDEDKVWGAEHLEYLYWEGFPSVIEL